MLLCTPQRTDKVQPTRAKLCAVIEFAARTNSHKQQAREENSRKRGIQQRQDKYIDGLCKNSRHSEREGELAAQRKGSAHVAYRAPTTAHLALLVPGISSRASVCCTSGASAAALPWLCVPFGTCLASLVARRPALPYYM